MQKSIILDQNFDIVRKKAYAIRHNYFDDMDKYLLNLEGSLLKKGLNVVWTKDINSLTQTIDSLINDLSVRRISFDSVFPFDNYLQNRVDVIPFDLLESSSDDLDLLVVDADFAVCENGSLVFLDKQSQCCFNKTKNIAVIVNIDQAIANQQDLSFFIALKYLSQSAFRASLVAVRFTSSRILDAPGRPAVYHPMCLRISRTAVYSPLY